MKTFIALLCTLTIGYYSYGQPCEKKYKDKLEESSELLKCGGNYTIEKLPTGSCLLKWYDAENKQITNLVTYKFSKL